MRQLTKDEAIRFYRSGLWRTLNFNQIVRLQLWQDKLCVPFDVFHEAIEKTLKRGVFTHEFAWRERLKQEYLGERKAPTFEEIMELIPENKRMIILAKD